MHRPSLIVIALLAGYVAAWAASSVLLTGRSDLDIFFWPAAETAANGHPILVYSTNTHGAGPFANGPVGLLPIIPVAWLANAAGWAGSQLERTISVEAVFALLSLPMAAMAVSIIRWGRGAVEWRLATYCAFLLAPTLWISLVDFGHGEQVIELTFVLLAVVLTLRGRCLRAGGALGLALLTRTTALLCVIPFALLPLATRRVKPAAVLLTATAVIVACGLLPFILADASNVGHSLVGYRGDEGIGGGSFWLLLLRTPLAGVAQRLDTYLALALAALLCGGVLLRRPEVALTPAGLCGLLAISAACFPMLAKTVYPYYLLEPYVFATIWWLARPGSALNWRAVMPVLVVLDALLREAVGLQQTGFGVTAGVASTLVLLVVVCLTTADLVRPLSRVTGARATPAVAAEATS